MCFDLIYYVTYSIPNYCTLTIDILPNMKQHETSPSVHAHNSRYETHETK